MYVTRLPETARCDKLVNEVFIKDTKLPETAPYDKHVNEVFIKDTKLPETALYDNFFYVCYKATRNSTIA